MLVQLLFKLLFPIVLLLAIATFYHFYRNTFDDIQFGKREIGLLIVGSASTMFFDLPLVIYKDYLLAVNIGGFVIPIVISFYIITVNTIHFSKLVISLFAVSLASFMVTNVTETGVISYFPLFFIPSILAVLFALLFFMRSPVACVFSYAIATLGIIIGADLAHLPEVFDTILKGSMGGAGIYDLVFLSGLISFFLTFLFIKKERTDKHHIMINRLDTEIYAASNIVGLSGSRNALISKFTGKTNSTISQKEALTIIKELDKKLKPYMAPLHRRIAAYIIDSAILFPLSLLLLVLFSLTLYMFLSLFLLMQLLYFISLEFWVGSTVGKTMVDIEIRNYDNRKPDFMTIFSRNILRLLEFFLFFYLFSILFIVITPRKQRLGDIISDSIVVKS